MVRNRSFDLIVGNNDLLPFVLQTYPAAILDASRERFGISGQSHGELRSR